ncbi:MAG: hypothetical protein UW81_C0006G0010 [Candidatus Giovannonibacteria bacterium GW2011_GWC2_44_9]|uniref:Uncharacterized protein n=3 Tax=Candidatus Giovannoniibacteriota TaxID=1752738 RepID=A0A0G1LW30_9BACT|nr:MAG: hypothetical protein UW49_C0004G0055 [Candidatus Giovannonibacteria bacterium GW2011_GWB1_44_23]KKT63944.1 MAG: hypothetical protein UW57_C0004G0054 [Candidatus Giovannonibacteria bacterium GW2011_GWA1_44_29]KKT84085.1 MAG: hypothetical protein UW81_C0006G0010 [Candidatus Giovannonibacteria bacterium GW2011_GWC2_44_9]KKT91657.1 MAG: hypothetical protein UW93_C0004G0055 [Parcubacteria group bacterium GW2011_GWC1_45_13]
MAKKAQIEPAQNCEETLNIEGVIFVCDSKDKRHINPHCSQRRVKSPEGYDSVYIITWRRVPDFISSQN